MSKLEFFDKKIRKRYDALIEEERCLSYIIEDLKDKYENVFIYDILDKDNTEIIINTEKDNVTISFDKDNTITLFSPNWEYQIVYSNTVHKNFGPLGIKYKKNNRSVLVTNPIDYAIYRYKFEIDSRKYEISINKENAIIDDGKIVNLLLNVPEIIGIIDIYAIIKKVVSFSDFYLKIKRNDDIDCGSMLIYSDEKINKYIEYFNNGYLKLYYDGNKILEEVIKQIPLEDDYKTYVKKIGEKNG